VFSSGMTVAGGGAATTNNSANLTNNATYAAEEIKSITNTSISNLTETVLGYWINASGFGFNASAEGVGPDNDEDGINDYEE